MTGFLEGLTDRGPTPALVKTLAFNEARLRMVSENIANIQTPGYRAKQLDVQGFQQSLRDALELRKKNPNAPFAVENKREVATRPDGTLKVTPSLVPPENILFHDGTNASLERQMAELAELGMVHDAATQLLQKRFEGLQKAIRGTVG